MQGYDFTFAKQCSHWYFRQFSAARPTLLRDRPEGQAKLPVPYSQKKKKLHRSLMLFLETGRIFQ